MGYLTSGPWEYVGNGIVRGPFALGDESKPGEEICTVSQYEVNRDETGRAIAAIPDLLAAFADAVSHFELAVNVAEAKDGLHMLDRTEIANWRALIARIA